MAKRGRTPSLIGSTMGTTRFVTAVRKRKCKRCDGGVPGGTPCVEVSKPGTMGSSTFCCDCYGGILEQTEAKLKELRQNFGAHRP